MRTLDLDQAARYAFHDRIEEENSRNRLSGELRLDFRTQEILVFERERAVIQFTFPSDEISARVEGSLHLFPATTSADEIAAWIEAQRPNRPPYTGPSPVPQPLPGLAVEEVLGKPQRLYAVGRNSFQKLRIRFAAPGVRVGSDLWIPAIEREGVTYLRIP